MKNTLSQGLYNRIRKIIENARGNIARAVNTEIVVAYWHIGREIVEEEQNGKSRADYGASILKNLSVKLTMDFGKGFDESNLRNIRYLYLTYPKCDALRHELSWTHYRILIDTASMIENTIAGKKGGGIAKKARLELEEQTGKKVVTAGNSLPPSKVIKKLRQSQV